MVSVIKHSYLSAGKEGREKAIAHIHYISSRPENKQRAQRFFFNASSQIIGKEQVLKRLEQQSKASVMHKLMLSPGAQDCDAEAYTKSILKELCSKKGLDLEWYAVIHRNTSHIHAHVIILGKDLNGTKVRFSRQDYKVMRAAGDQYLLRTRAFERVYNSRDRHFENRVYVPGITKSRTELSVCSQTARSMASQLSRQISLAPDSEIKNWQPNKLQKSGTRVVVNLRPRKQATRSKRLNTQKLESKTWRIWLKKLKENKER